MAAVAQPVRKVARVGVVSVGGPTAEMTGPLPANRTVRAFLRGMAELGYVYGRDFVTEARGTDRIGALAELVDLQVDIIVATGGGTVLSSLKQATTTIPIVMTAASDDPVRQGLVQSLAHPRSNFTGMSLQTSELTGKRLELLKDLVPGAGVVAVFWDSTSPALWPAAVAAGQARGWRLQSIEIRDVGMIARAFKTASDAGAVALLVPASGLLLGLTRSCGCCGRTSRCRHARSTPFRSCGRDLTLLRRTRGALQCPV